MQSNNPASAHASDAPWAVTLTEETIARAISNFCETTATVAVLAQELAVRFAVLSRNLRPGDVIDADHLLFQLSDAVVEAGKVLDGALGLTVLSIMPTSHQTTVN